MSDLPEYFFALSAGAGMARTRIEALGKLIAFRPIFLTDILGAAPDSISEALGACEYGFFDLSAHEIDVLVALGIGLESDAQCFTLIEADERPPAKATILGRLTPPPRTYVDAQNLHLRIRAIIEETRGARAVQNDQLSQSIKRKLSGDRAISLRRLAAELGRPRDEVRPIVRAMLANNELTKINDKRWAEYRLS